MPSMRPDAAERLASDQSYADQSPADKRGAPDSQVSEEGGVGTGQHATPVIAAQTESDVCP